MFPVTNNKYSIVLQKLNFIKIKQYLQKKTDEKKGGEQTSFVDACSTSSPTTIKLLKSL